MKKATCVYGGLLLCWLAGAGCGGGDDDQGAMSKQEAARLAKTDVTTDFCELFDWYGDGICDEFCIQPDPDCESGQGCYVGGCSRQLCGPIPGLNSTCEWLDYYACYDLASCELLDSGSCAWTGDSDFIDCLYQNGACPYYDQPPPWWCDGGELVPQDPDGRGCPRPPACKRGEGATCGGEHDFQCDPGLYCVEGTCTDQLPECYVGGCSRQLCGPIPGLNSTCEWLDYYACYDLASCELLDSGSCAWTGDSDFIDCLYQNGACPYYDQPPPWWCDGGELVPQDPDGRGCPRPPACKRGEGATCGGEHDFQCDPGLVCIDGSCSADG